MNIQNDRWKVIAFNSEIATGHSTNSTWPNFIYFSDSADSNPHHTISAGKQVLYNKTGVWYNTLIVGTEVRDIIRLHPDTSRIRKWEEYTEEVLRYIQTGTGNPASLSPYADSLIADLFCLDQIIVDDDFCRDMLLCYVSKTDGRALNTGILFKDVIS